MRALIILALLFFSAAGSAESDSQTFRVTDGVPAGFESLAEKQSTHADIYYGGIFLMSTFVTFDMLEVEIEDPSAVVEAIPNVRDPYLLAQTLSGPLSNNSSLKCTSRRVDGCGKLTPEIAGIIFDDANYRLDLFVASDQLLVHELAHEKYLPPASVDQSTLHNVRIALSGVGGEGRYTIGNESYFAWKNAHIKSRYHISDSGLTLSELSWQRDDPDMEYEIGAFRGGGRELAFSGEVAMLGGRLSTSTKTRTDLMQVMASPVFLFLDERSQVNVYRGNELIHSTFLDAGNHELDTREYPDGAYDIRIETSGISGQQDSQTQFFVRSQNLPIPGERNYFVEAGALMQTDAVGVPDLIGEAWVRGGMNHRLAKHFSMDSELIYADGKALVQSGLFALNRRGQFYGGLMLSTESDIGYSLRASYVHKNLTAFLDFRQLRVREQGSLDEYNLLRRSYSQGSASLAFPLGKGRMFIRATLNKQAISDRSSVGVSYLGPLFKRWGFQADLRLDAQFSNEDNWVKAGVTLRRLRGVDSIVLAPSVRRSDLDGTDASFNGYWTGAHHWDPIGDFQRSTYLSHRDGLSSFGSRFMPRSMPGSDFEFGVQQRDRTDVFYALNHSMSVATTADKVTVGSAGSTAGAVVVDIGGAIDGQFEVRVDSRVVGYAWANKPSIISLRPYESYRIRVNPISDNIVGFDDSVREITVYPGNVEVLKFEAYEITVLVGQAVDEQGDPLEFARFKNSVGLGLTDADGWYQIEVKNRKPLVVAKRDGTYCQIELPELTVVQNLAVLDVLTCTAIQAPPSVAG